MLGNASSRVNTVTPHAGQKFVSLQRPASEAESRQRFGSPLIVATDSAKNAEYENALPLRRWQSRHEQA